MIPLNRDCPKLNPYARISTKAYPGSVGYDLYVSERKVLRAGERALIRIDIQLAIPKGYYGSIVGRSGLANSRGVVAFPGTLGSDYREIVCVILFNLGHDYCKVEKGCRIAQLIIRKCYDVTFVLCDDTEFGKYCNTDRGSDGFGSSLGF